VWSTIVGVVAGTVFDGLDEGARSEIFRPFWQAPMPYLTFVVKGAAETATLVPAVRRAVMEVDPEQSITEVMTMEEVLRDSLGPRRFSMQLIALFALAALLLAAIGLYGVLSYSVTQRANEIGIRMALGASTGSVLNHVMKEGFLLVLFGLAAGIVLALVVARVISSMIFGVSPADPVALGTSVIVMAAIALAASAVPAVRATRTDPATVLRAE